MDDIAIIDKFLKHLYDKGNKGACLVDVVSVDRPQRDRIETTLTGKELVDESKSFVAGKRKFKISSNGIDIVSNYNSYSEYLEEKNKPQKSRTTNIHAENVAYIEGDNNGNQSFSSKNKNKPIVKNDDTSTISNLTVSIIGGVVVGLILFYIFGIGG